MNINKFFGSRMVRRIACNKEMLIKHLQQLDGGVVEARVFIDLAYDGEFLDGGFDVTSLNAEHPEWTTEGLKFSSNGVHYGDGRDSS